MAQLQLTEPDPDHLTVKRRRLSIIRKKGQLPEFAFTFFEDLYRFAPSGLLAIIDLPQIQNLSLNHPITLNPAILNNTPVTMFLAVFQPFLGTQKHAGSLANYSNKSMG